MFSQESKAKAKWELWATQSRQPEWTIWILHWSLPPSVSFLADSWLSTASFREMSLSSNPGNGDIEWKDGRDITLLYNHAAVSSMKFLLLLPWKVSLHWDHTGIFFYFSNFFFFAFLFGYFVKSTMLNHIFLVRKSACLWSKWKAEEQALSSTVLNIVVRLSSYKKKKIIVKSTNQCTTNQK